MPPGLPLLALLKLVTFCRASPRSCAGQEQGDSGSTGPGAGAGAAGGAGRQHHARRRCRPAAAPAGRGAQHQQVGRGRGCNCEGCTNAFECGYILCCKRCLGVCTQIVMQQCWRCHSRSSMCRLQSEITAEHQKFENWRQENVRRRCVSDTCHHRHAVITVYRIGSRPFSDLLCVSRWNYLPLIFQMLQMLVRIRKTLAHLPTLGFCSHLLSCTDATNHTVVACTQLLR